MRSDDYIELGGAYKPLSDAFNEFRYGLNNGHDTIPCGALLKTPTPKNWKQNNQEAIKNWMERLPEVYDLNSALENDKKWELKLSIKNDKK